MVPVVSVSSAPIHGEKLVGAGAGLIVAQESASVGNCSGAQLVCSATGRPDIEVVSEIAHRCASTSSDPIDDDTWERIGDAIASGDDSGLIGHAHQFFDICVCTPVGKFSVDVCACQTVAAVKAAFVVKHPECVSFCETQFYWVFSIHDLQNERSLLSFGIDVSKRGSEISVNGRLLGGAEVSFSCPKGICAIKNHVNVIFAS